jgi:NAD(P)-dependent dehydrogenase (short-subunit alcohol dehydrogenase family)
VTFAGRVAVVTGASSSVGKAIAMALIAAGVSVHALSRRPPCERADGKKDGTFVHVFLIKSTAPSLHVCNAPSPAPTSAIPIASELLSRAADQFRWKYFSPKIANYP